MFGPPGIAYVYLVYGMYDCLNVVTETGGRPAAVLVRAVEPIEGEREMRDARIRSASRRARDDAERRTIAARLERLAAARLASGPGLVAAAFDINRADSGTDLLDPGGSLRLEPATRTSDVVALPRVGIAYAPEPWRSLPWRFVDPVSPSISR